MKIMSIDIGTNSTLFLIAEVIDNEVTLLERGISDNSLGAEIGADSRISERLLEKNRLILRSLAQKAKEFGCISIGAVGTHALRNSRNSDEFVNMAHKEGVNLKIISDEDEADLAWKGVFGVKGPEKRTALLDLGGGSTELIIGKGNHREYSDSIPLGAVSLSRNYFRHDPPLHDEVVAASRTVNETFKKWSAFHDEDFEPVGIAGTITALTAIKYKIKEYTPGGLNGLLLTPDDVSSLKGTLLSMNLNERECLPGMPPARASSIHAGALTLETILTIIGRRDITVSEKGVLFGLAIEMAEVA